MTYKLSETTPEPTKRTPKKNSYIHVLIPTGLPPRAWHTIETDTLTIITIYLFREEAKSPSPGPLSPWDWNLECWFLWIKPEKLKLVFYINMMYEFVSCSINIPSGLSANKQ